MIAEALADLLMGSRQEVPSRGALVDKIAEIDVIANPARLCVTELMVLDET
jgi:hypothetical protein